MRLSNLSLIVTLVSGTMAFGALEVSPPCQCHGGRAVEVSGDIHHYSHPRDLKVEGAEDPAVFANEVYGSDFTVRIKGLPPGTYIVDVTEAEMYDRGPGQRMMNITSGETMLADHLDLVKAAGFAHEYHVIGKVQLSRGPLDVRFVALHDNAKFNAIKILDANQNEVAFAKAADFGDPGYALAAKVPEVKEPPIFRDPSQPMEARVNDLIRRMSVSEKVAQLQNSAPAIPRLGVPGDDYWNEGLHGIAREGDATVFPQAIGMAATWDDALIKRQGDVVSTEARAKYNEKKGNEASHARYNGLTLWSPNINIYRDPRWGRGQETYGEDPWLTSRMGVAYITGLQGDDPKYLKVLACAKHFAVHSGPESLRHRFDARPPERDLYETYLPQFEAAVREANVGQVMSAYNAINGVPAPADSWLLTDLLRKQWGFSGYVVSDCDAVADVSGGHHYAIDNEHGAAESLLAGNDLNCGSAYRALAGALNDGLVKEADIDAALRRVLTARFRLGMFDPPDFSYSKITIAANDTPEHSALALQVAREAMVLLKNNGVLPLDKAKLHQIAVIGANANDTEMLEGNYNGHATHPANILQGITNAAGPGMKVTYDRGCPLAGAIDPKDEQNALTDAAQADVVIYAGGLNQHFEGEEGEGGDRTQIEIPESQDTLLKALAATGKPVVFVNCSGGAVAMPWEAENLPAILQAWYPGENGGIAVADVLFGNYNPAGRLPITFYKSTQDLPDFQNYSMADRTYRYFTGGPLFAFGHGLSYTHFDYTGVSASLSGTEAEVAVNVRNSGGRDGEEVVQVYVRHLQSQWSQPTHSLVAFKRIPIAEGQSAPVKVMFGIGQLRCWDIARKQYVVEPGDYEVQVGAASDDIRGTVRVHIDATAAKSYRIAANQAAGAS